MLTWSPWARWRARGFSIHPWASTDDVNVTAVAAARATALTTFIILQYFFEQKGAWYVQNLQKEILQIQMRSTTTETLKTIMRGLFFSALPVSSTKASCLCECTIDKADARKDENSKNQNTIGTINMQIQSLQWPHSRVHLHQSFVWTECCSRGSNLRASSDVTMHDKHDQSMTYKSKP